MKHIREMASSIDLFIAPSQFLKDRFTFEFGIDRSKILYLDYGFHRNRLQGRKRDKEDRFIFGYIGTHKQAKGIFHLLQAFAEVDLPCELKIWGSTLAPFTQSLKAYVKSLGREIENRVHWMGGYRNDNIVCDVFNHVDAIVVPSIWGENSPLVIHEALEAQVAVITANYGGMKEYVQHEVNGLLFEHRNPKSLSKEMRRMIDNPQLTDKIAKGGYLQSEDRRIPDIETHVFNIVSLYNQILTKRRANDYETRTMAYHL
jgi:glycosyltransferase involved in cell wall biosynthesis